MMEEDRIACRDDILAQVIGPDSRGCIRGVGGGVTPISVFGSGRGTSCKEEAQRLREAYNA